MLDAYRRTGFVLMLALLIGSPALAKSPLSAFGDGFDKGLEEGHRDRDDAAPDGDPRNARPPKTMQKVQPPRASIRNKISLDGGQGEREDLDDGDDEL
jgi:hypothetical protein